MTTQKKYWLGYEEPGEQDEFFLEALDNDIWSAGSEDDWDACWSTEMPDPEQFETLNANKTINHIPGNSALTIKSSLYTTLHKAKLAVKDLPQEERYQFFPYTYSMPEDYFKFQQAAANNPEQRWIQKPRNMSRGRGIEVVQHPETIPLEDEWIIQEYLDQPHLWNGFKYVLRCYVLITSVEPLRFYWYHEGSAKLTSEKYDLDDLDNPYRHLTNPDINEHNTEADVPVIFHSFRVYKEWLRSEGIDIEKLFADIQDLINLTVIASREKMRDQAQSYSADTQGAYELLGLDLMVDKNLKPWILECNLSPSLEVCSTDETQGREELQTKKGMVTEIVNMLGLNDKDHHLLTQTEKAQRELERAKGFKCLFPSENANEYLNCFPIPRFADVNSLPNGFKIDYEKLYLQSQTGTEAVFDDSLALLAHDSTNQTSAYITPNELATWIWLQNSAGKKPEEIAQELSETFGPPAKDPENNDGVEATWLSQIWDILSDWSHAHLFSQSDIKNTTFTDTQEAPQTWETVGYLNLAGVSVQLRCACPIASQYLKHFTDKEKLYSDNTQYIDIVRSSYGYVLINETQVLSGSRKLSRLMDDCIKLISKKCLQADDIALLQGSVISLNNKNAIIIGDQEQLDSFAYEFCMHQESARMLSGSPIISAQKNVIKCTDLPLLLPSNTDSISSSYDPSNYYPQKPTTTSPSKETLVKRDWTISETHTQPCWSASVNGVFEEYAQIKAIIFLESSDDVNNASIETITNANTLAKLWTNSINKKSSTAEKLPEWLKGIQGYSLNCLDLKQAKSMINEVASLLN